MKVNKLPPRKLAKLAAKKPGQAFTFQGQPMRVTRAFSDVDGCMYAQPTDRLNGEFINAQTEQFKEA